MPSALQGNRVPTSSARGRGGAAPSPANLRRIAPTGGWMKNRMQGAGEAPIVAELLDIFSQNAFAGRNVLVTGGTSGIGLGAALVFRDLGAVVSATGATAAECSAARAQDGNAGIAFTQLDVREAPAIGALIAGLPGLDIVVNAAGIIRRD